MKKVILLFGLLLVLMSSLSAQSYSGGSGTEVYPYQIADKADLKYLSENSHLVFFFPLKKYFNSLLVH